VLNRLFASTRSSLKARLVGWFLGLSVLVVAATTIAAFSFTREALQRSMFDRLTAVAVVEESELNRWVDHARNMVVLFSRLPSLAQPAAALRANDESSPESLAAQQELLVFLDRAMATMDDFEELLVLSVVGGHVVASTDRDRIGGYRISELFFERGRRETYVQNVYASPLDGSPTLTISSPIRDERGLVVAVLASHLDLSRLDRILGDRSGLGLTGEAYLVSQFNDFVSSERLGRDEYRRGVHTEGINRALSGENGAALYENYAGVPVIGAFRFNRERQMALLVEMSQSEAFAPARRLLLALLGVGLVALVLLTSGVVLVSRRVADPIIAVTEAATRVAAGDLSTTAPVTTQDEVGRLAGAFNEMTGQLQVLYGDLHDQVDATTRAMEALQENEQLLQAIIDNSATLVTVTDPDGKLLLANDRFESLFGLPRGRARGRHVDEVLSEAAADLIGSLQAEAYTERRLIEREVALPIAGEIRSFFAVCFPLWDAGKEPYGVGLVATDFTERKRTEQERLRLEAQVQHAQKLESLGVLAGGIAHDFNNLLAAILGNADLALGSLTSPAEARTHLDQVLIAAQRAAELTNQMLAYAGKASFQTETLDLNAVVEEMSQLVRVSLPKKVALEFRLSPLPTYIQVDSAQIRQVVLNLVTNAADAIGDTPGTVTLRTEAITVDQEYLAERFPHESLEDGSYVLLTVEDTGCGMDEHTLGRIFDPFYSTKESGRGLGLAAVTGIVRGSGGALTVTSAPGSGSTFEVLLPSVPSKALGDSPAESSPPPGGLEGTILVVDDEDMVRQMAKTSLERSGFEVLEAADGLEAVALFKERMSEISAVVLDMTMPGMGGAEVFRELRALDDSVVVLVSSGYDRQDTVRGLGVMGGTDFLQKPYRPRVLVEKVTELVESRRAGA